MNLMDLTGILKADVADFVSKMSTAATSVESMDPAAQKAGNGLVTLGQKMDGLNSSMQSWGKALLTALPFAALGTAAYNAQETMEEAYNKIRITTGATGEKLKELKENFDEVFANVPVSAGIAAQAMVTISTRTGLTGEALENMTKKMITFADRLGGDINGTVTELTNTFSQWHIQTKEQASAMDYLLTVSQRTNTPIGSMLGLLSRFAPMLREVKFSFDQSAAMIGAFTKAGDQSGRMMISLQMALRKMANEGKNPAEEFARIVNAIKNATTEEEASALAMSKFNRAGLQMAAAIRSGRLDLEEFIKTARATGDTVDAMAEDTEQDGQMFAKLGHSITIMLQPLGEALQDTLKNIIAAIRPVVQMLTIVGQQFAKLPGPIQTVIIAVTGLGASWSLITKVISTVVNSFSAFTTFLTGLAHAFTASTVAATANTTATTTAAAATAASTIIWQNAARAQAAAAAASDLYTASLALQAGVQQKLLQPTSLVADAFVQQSTALTKVANTGNAIEATYTVIGTSAAKTNGVLGTLIKTLGGLSGALVAAAGSWGIYEVAQIKGQSSFAKVSLEIGAVAFALGAAIPSVGKFSTALISGLVGSTGTAASGVAGLGAKVIEFGKVAIPAAVAAITKFSFTGLVASISSFLTGAWASLSTAFTALAIRAIPAAIGGIAAFGVALGTVALVVGAWQLGGMIGSFLKLDEVIADTIPLLNEFIDLMMAAPIMIIEKLTGRTKELTDAQGQSNKMLEEVKKRLKALGQEFQDQGKMSVEQYRQYLLKLLETSEKVKEKFDKGLINTMAIKTALKDIGVEGAIDSAQQVQHAYETLLDAFKNHIKSVVDEAGNTITITAGIVEAARKKAEEANKAVREMTSSLQQAFAKLGVMSITDQSTELSKMRAAYAAIAAPATAARNALDAANAALATATKAFSDGRISAEAYAKAKRDVADAEKALAPAYANEQAAFGALSAAEEKYRLTLDKAANAGKERTAEWANAVDQLISKFAAEQIAVSSLVAMQTAQQSVITDLREQYDLLVAAKASGHDVDAALLETEQRLAESHAVLANITGQLVLKQDQLTTTTIALAKAGATLGTSKFIDPSAWASAMQKINFALASSEEAIRSLKAEMAAATKDAVEDAAKWESKLVGTFNAITGVVDAFDLSPAMRELKELTEAFNTVAKESPQALNTAANKAAEAFRRIKESGVATTKEISDAFSIMSDKMLAATTSFQVLGQKSSAYLSVMAEKARMEYERVKADGTSTARDIMLAHRDYIEKTIEYYRAMGIKVPDEMERMLKKIDEKMKTHVTAWERFIQGFEQAWSTLAQNISHIIANSLVGPDPNKQLKKQVKDLKDSVEERKALWQQDQDEAAAAREKEKNSYEDYVKEAKAQLQSIREEHSKELAAEVAEVKKGVREQEKEYEDFAAETAEKWKEIQEQNTADLKERLSELSKNLNDERDQYEEYCADIKDQLKEVSESHKKAIEEEKQEVLDSLAEQEQAYNDYAADTQDQILRALASGDADTGEQVYELQRSLGIKQAELEKYRKEADKKQEEITQKHAEEQKKEEDALQKSLANRKKAWEKYQQEYEQDVADAQAKAQEALRQDELDLKDQLERKKAELEDYKTEAQNRINEITAANAASLAQEEADLQESLGNRKQQYDQALLDIQSNLDQQKAEYDQFLADVDEQLEELNGEFVTFFGQLTESFQAFGVGMVDSIVGAITGSLFDKLKPAMETVFGKVWDSVKGWLGSVFGDFSESLGGWLGGLFGGGGGAASAAGTAAGGAASAAGSVAGGAGSVAGGVAAAAGSIMGTIGAIGSVGSMISGVIGNFQNAKMETTLNAIEWNTRKTSLHAEHMLTGPMNTYLPGIKDIHDYLYQGLHPMLQGISDAVTHHIPPMHTALSNVETALTGAFITLPSINLSKLEGFAEDISNTLTVNFKSLLEKIDTGIGLLSAFLAGAPTTVPSGIVPASAGITPQSWANTAGATTPASAVKNNVTIGTINIYPPTATGTDIVDEIAQAMEDYGLKL